MATIRKDGKAYDSGDVLVTIDGVQEMEVAEISYNTSQEHQINHSLANRGTSWSMGKITHEATITLFMAAAAKLENLTGGDLTRMKPFDINVTFYNEFADLVNDTITCKFMSQGREVTGEMGLKKQYTLFVLDISFNNT